MIDRAQGYEILKNNLSNKNLVFHSIAVARVMEKLAESFGKDADKWFMAGLLHDVDYELTKDDPKAHALKARAILAELNLDEDVLHAIEAHSGNVPLESEIDRHLWAADPITGLIVASALMRPDKKISTITLKSLKKKFKSKAFAKGANREQIASCANFGMEIGEFLQLALDAMASFESELGF